MVNWKKWFLEEDEEEVFREEEEKVEKAKKIQDSQRLYLSFLYLWKNICVFKVQSYYFFLEVFKKKIIFFP